MLLNSEMYDLISTQFTLSRLPGNAAIMVNWAIYVTVNVITGMDAIGWLVYGLF